MAQDEQESLIEWLKTNNFIFMKDALVEEGYTLEMVIDMTDKDIDDIVDALNMSKLKRPRFRNAVKKLKENNQPTKAENTRNNNSKNTKDEIKETDINNSAMDSVHHSKVIKNVLALNICINKYGKKGSPFEDLEGPTRDMKQLIDLWQNKFGYRIICNDYDKNLMGYYVSKEDFLQKLDECRMELRSKKNNYDGLIFVFSGHGYKKSIVTSDSLYVSIDKIKKHFGSKEIAKLKDKPKIYILDCCRSIAKNAWPCNDDDDDSRLVSQMMKTRGKSGLNANNNLKFYHPFINTIEIYGNAQGYAVGDSKSGGSLITLITKHLSHYAINDSKNHILSEKTFEELLYPVQTALHNSKYGNQTMEITKRLLGYRLYLSINDKHNSDERKTKEEKEEGVVVSSQVKPQEPASKKTATAAEEEKTGDVFGSKMNDIRWRFDFHYDKRNRGSKVHGIDENGRHFQCNHDDGYCSCFSTIIGTGMVYNSGIYKIKFKIDKIYNAYGYGNILGLTSDNFGSIDLDKYNGDYKWYQYSFKYIGWSSLVYTDEYLPNGLYCGSTPDTCARNIFRRAGFKYVSRNGKYGARLPFLRSSDRVVMVYNSDLGELSFELYRKENGKESLLDSFIHNLPRGLTFYWFCGHSYKPMSITILD